MPKTKRCSYMGCNNDNRYPNRLGMSGTFYVPFPKPIMNRDKCITWIKLCALNKRLDQIKQGFYICSLHFLGGKGPTKDHPDPIAYRNSTATNKNSKNAPILELKPSINSTTTLQGSVPRLISKDVVTSPIEKVEFGDYSSSANVKVEIMDHEASPTDNVGDSGCLPIVKGEIMGHENVGDSGCLPIVKVEPRDSSSIENVELRDEALPIENVDSGGLLIECWDSEAAPIENVECWDSEASSNENFESRDRASPTENVELEDSGASPIEKVDSGISPMKRKLELGRPSRYLAELENICVKDLPNGWGPCKLLSKLMFNKYISFDAPVMSLLISTDGSFKVSINGASLPEDNQSFLKIPPQHIFNKEDLIKAITFLNILQICKGNPEEQFTSITRPVSGGVLRNQSMHSDTCLVVFEERNIRNNIKRCKNCGCLRKSLQLRVRRNQKGRIAICPTKCPYSLLSVDELRERLKQSKKQLAAVKQCNTRLRQKISKELNQEPDTDSHDFATFISQNIDREDTSSFTFDSS